MSGVIGLLVCEVLEEEVASLLAADPDLGRVGILASENTLHLQRLLEEHGREAQILRAPEDFQPTGGADVLLLVLRVGLHMDKEDLREGLREAALGLAQHVDVLALGYGLCGNVLEKPEELLQEVEVPLILPRNDDGSIIDDCVCLVLGGTSRYLEQVHREAGTWFLTPGWLRHWETLLVKELRANDIPTVKWIFDRTGYKRALMVDTGTADKSTFTEESQRFADTFDFYVEEVRGSLHILERQLQEAKAYVKDAGTAST